MLPGAKKFNFFCHFKVNNSIFNKFHNDINIAIQPYVTRSVCNAFCLFQENPRLRMQQCTAGSLYAVHTHSYKKSSTQVAPQNNDAMSEGNYSLETRNLYPVTENDKQTRHVAPRENVTSLGCMLPCDCGGNFLMSYAD